MCLCQNNDDDETHRNITLRQVWILRVMLSEGKMQKRDIKRRKRKFSRYKPSDSGAPVTVARLFLLLLFIIIVVNLIIPDRLYSAGENRTLTTRPIMSTNNILSGSYMEQYERYLRDQIFGRGLLRTFSINIRRLGGNRVEEGVFLGRGNQLLEDIVAIDSENLAENIEGIQSFIRRYPTVNHHMILVPDAANIWADQLPPLATVIDQNRQFSLVRTELEDHLVWIDVSEALQESNEKIYHQTDHHWTSLGAFLAFQEAAPLLRIEGDFSTAFAAFPVTTNFRGGLATRSGFLPAISEEIFIFVPRGEATEVIVNYLEEQRRATTLFQQERLDGGNPHDIFLGGGTSVVAIQSPSFSNRRLLIINDSFANSFVQFLIPHFREIILVNPRYYTGTIDELMLNYRVTDSLILYSGNGFFSDNHLSGVMRSE